VVVDFLINKQMEKNTKIILGIGAAIALYLILKPKTAAAQTDTATLPAPLPDPVVDPLDPVRTDPIVVDQSKIDTDVIKTKDCEVRTYNCKDWFSETIQIQMWEDCATYQPVLPPCRPSPDDFMVAELFAPNY